jgi:hypothetical protein
MKAALVTIVVAASAPARADPLPVVERVGDANLEPVGPHRGLTLNVVLSGATIIAADSTGDVGRGPGGSLRIGEAMTPDTVLTIEVTVGSMLDDEVDVHQQLGRRADRLAALRAAVAVAARRGRCRQLHPPRVVRRGDGAGARHQPVRPGGAVRHRHRRGSP